MSYLLLLALLSLPLTTQAKDVIPLRINNCMLAGQPLTGDNTFRIPEMSRLDLQALTVSCFVTGQESQETLARLTVKQQEEEVKDIYPEVSFSFSAPAGTVFFPAKKALSAGTYLFQVALSSPENVLQSTPYTFPVEIAQGEGFASPEIAQINAKQESGEPSSENTSLARTTFSWWIVGGASIIALLLLGVWVKLKRRG